jgi:predicted nucleotidyltransferase
MSPLIAAHKDEVAEVCRRFHVARLEVFGSAARATDFDPERSDVDLIVSYDPDNYPSGIGDFFDLRTALTVVFGRSVDLTMATAVRNPYLRAEMERDREMLYAA